MTDDPVIDAHVRVDHVSKRYRLGHERSNARLALPGALGEPHGRRSFLALDDVSFEIGRGEAVGIVGSNGAGKSTLLKVISGTVYPTEGTVTVPNNFVSLIELGLGFDSEMSGEENLYYGAAFLGRSAEEVAERRDWIVEFADLAEFMDMPVKRYSSGMLARLGFSLAAAFPADLFVVDEVLSVGDWGFQRRSLELMRDHHRNGSTLLFVSHNHWLVTQLCERAILLENGRVVADGRATSVLGTYLGGQQFVVTPSGVDISESSARLTKDDATGTPIAPESAEADAPVFDPAAAGAAVVLRRLVTEPVEIGPGDPLDLILDVDVVRATSDLRVVFTIYWEGFAAMAAPEVLDSPFLRTPGRHRVRYHFDIIPGSPSLATLQIAVVTPDDPDDPEQLLPHAVDRIECPLVIVGELTGRPGVYFPVTLVDVRERDDLPST